MDITARNIGIYFMGNIKKELWGKYRSATIFVITNESKIIC